MTLATMTEAQGLGLDESALVYFGEHRMLPEVADALRALTAAAARSGFDLRVASAYRSYARQLLIWNAKLRGDRRVTDDRDQTVDMESLEPTQRLDAVLRFSALPGTSRHHWGTDLDVFDASAVSDSYQVQLSAEEVCEGGCFAALHDWLDTRIEAGESYGFYRPYNCDRGGVAPERWHLSYAPLAQSCANQVSREALLRLWRQSSELRPLGQEVLVQTLDAVLDRYVLRVATPPSAALGYCGAESGAESGDHS